MTENVTTFVPKPPPQCGHCNDVGRISSEHLICKGSGVIGAGENWHYCTCSNARCIHCGGPRWLK